MTLDEFVNWKGSANTRRALYIHGGEHSNGRTEPNVSLSEAVGHGFVPCPAAAPELANSGLLPEHVFRFSGVDDNDNGMVSFALFEVNREHRLVLSLGRPDEKSSVVCSVMTMSPTYTPSCEPVVSYLLFDDLSLSFFDMLCMHMSELRSGIKNNRFINPLELNALYDICCSCGASSGLRTKEFWYKYVDPNIAGKPKHVYVVLDTVSQSRFTVGKVLLTRNSIMQAVKDGNALSSCNGLRSDWTVMYGPPEKAGTHIPFGGSWRFVNEEELAVLCEYGDTY